MRLMCRGGCYNGVKISSSRLMGMILIALGAILALLAAPIAHSGGAAETAEDIEAEERGASGFYPGTSHVMETYPDEPNIGEHEGAVMNIRFNDEHGSRVRDEEVTFYVESDRDDIDIALSEALEGEVTLMTDPAEEKAWEITAVTDFIEGITLKITGARPGEATLRVGGWEDDRVNPTLNRGTQTYAFQTEGITGVRLSADKEQVEPTETVNLRAQLTEGDYPAREGMTVRFEARRDGEGEWNELDEKATDEDGTAELEVDTAVAGHYDIRAFHPGEERIFATTEVVVEPGPVDAVISCQDEKAVDVAKEEFTVYFALVDAYDNWITDKDKIEVTITDPEYERLSQEDERVSVELVEECKENVRYEMFAVTVEHAHQFGINEYLVEGRISGTTLTESVVVRVAEFGELVDLELKLSRDTIPVDFQDTGEETEAEAVEESPEEFSAEEEALFARVYLEGEHGVTRAYDPAAGDILFTTSDGAVATIDSTTGELTVRGTGETVITAYHEEEGLEDQESLIVYDPDIIDEKEDIEALEEQDDFQVVTLSLDEEVIDVNGEELEVTDAPIIQEGRTFLPLPIMAEIYGAELDFDPREEAITAAMDERTVIFNLGETKMTIDGEAQNMDAAPFIDEEDELVYLPVRFVTQALDGEVSFDGTAREITIMK